MLFCLLFPSSSPDKKWKNWLEKVSYIITPFEREIFHSLKTDKQREAFIKKFWLIRDPVPETPVNEFKVEYEKRWNYVNSHFSSPGKKDGWKTDMGRIYLLLGKPIEIQRFETYSQIYPCQLWLYRGDKTLGLPAYFYIIFYKKKGIGKYQLYNPSMDGPENLLTPEMKRVSISRYEALKTLHRISPELARASTSYLLSEGEDIYSLNLGGSSNWLLSRIFSIPETIYENSIKNKAIKGYVEVSEYLISKKSTLTYSYVKEGKNYLLSLAIQPENLSFRKTGEVYRADLNLQIVVHTPSHKVIFERTRILKLQANEEKYRIIKDNPIIIEEILPMVPGLNRLTIILKNMVDKSFYTHDKWINISSDVPVIQIIPSFRIKKTTSFFSPFVFKEDSILPNPSSTFRLNDEVFLTIYYRNIKGQAYGKIRRLNKLIKEFKLHFNGEGVIVLRLSGSLLGVGKYIINIGFGEKSFNISDEAIFYIAPREGKTVPSFLVSSYRSKEDMLWETGKMLISSGSVMRGLNLLEEAFPSKPTMKDYLFLANAYIKTGKFAKAVEVLQPFLRSSRREPKIFAAMAYIRMNRLSEALSLLNSIDVKDDRVYNLIGEAYFRKGMVKKAIRAWKKSLEINPAQKELKNKILKFKG